MSRLFLPAATNYCTNPRLVDSNADGLSDISQVASTGSTVTTTLRDSGLGYYIQKVRVVGTAGSSGTTYIYPGIGPGSGAGSFSTSDYGTASIYYRVIEAANVTPYLRVISQQAGGSWISPSDVLVSGSDFSRFSVTRVFSADTLISQAGMMLYATNTTNGVWECEFYRPQLEKSPVATPYFDGTSTDSLNASTYAWTGTANASTSTRVMSQLDWNGYGATAGTLAARFVPSYVGGNAQYGIAVVSGAGADEVVDLRYGGGTTCAIYVRATDASTQSSLTAAAPTADVPNSAIGRWSATCTADLMLNGVAATQSAGGKTTKTPTRFGVGRVSAASLVNYGGIGPVLLSSQRKSDAWTTAMDTLLRASVVDLPAIKRMMAPGDALFTGSQADLSIIYVKGS